MDYCYDITIQLLMIGDFYSIDKYNIEEIIILKKSIEIKNSACFYISNIIKMTH
jgi:hypothetical protein